MFLFQRPWPTVGRYLLATAIGVAAWVANAVDLLASPHTPRQEELLFWDVVIGVVVSASLPLRRRYPFAIACVAIAAVTVSAASLGALMFAVVSMATRRRLVEAVGVTGVSVAGGIVAMLIDDRFDAGSVVVSLLLLTVCLAAGAYSGARRDLLTSLRERASTAEREQALSVVAAREAERTRIAREMHDVLAHRISLVALHAGALAYRSDLSKAETTGTAEIIQANAQLALVELRQVLGVLRTPEPDDDEDPDGLGIEPPQPTLAELPALLADASEAGCDVRLDTAVKLGEVSDTVSRTAFRIVQEALTNARKHAPGAPVVVRIAAEGSTLAVEVVNPTTVAGQHGGAGVGLVGLAERAELAGGTLTAGARPDGTFTVTAGLPWTRP